MTRAPTFPPSAARSTIFEPTSGGGGETSPSSAPPHACSSRSGPWPFPASAATLELSRIGDAGVCAPPSAGKTTGSTLFRTNPCFVRIGGAWRQVTAAAAWFGGGDETSRVVRGRGASRKRSGVMRSLVLAGHASLNDGAASTRGKVGKQARCPNAMVVHINISSPSPRNSDTYFRNDSSTTMLVRMGQGFRARQLVGHANTAVQACMP